MSAAAARRDPGDLSEVFWVDPVVTPLPPLSGDEVADVVVVGGGFTGLAAALFIRKAFPQRRVLLLEERLCGHGASGRNAGMAIPGVNVGPDVLERSLGTERARRTVRLLSRGVEIIDELSRRHGYDCAFERTGTLALGRNDRHARAHRVLAAAHRRLGVEAEYLDRDHVRRALASERFVSGLRLPDAALVHPWRAVRGLMRAALDAGVVIREQTQVLQVREGDPHRLTCPGGEAKAPHLVLATNAWSSRLGYFVNRVAPVHVSTIVTAPLSPARRLSLAWERREAAWEEGWLYHYFRLTPDDRVLIGGGWAVYRMGDGLRLRNPAPIYRRLEAGLLSIFPQLRGVAITHRWNGPVGFTRDFLPSIGVTGRRRNILYACGYTGHGVAMSHLAGEVLRDLYAGERTDLTDLFLVNRPFRSLTCEPLKWLVINTVRNGYLILDRLNV